MSLLVIVGLAWTGLSAEAQGCVRVAYVNGVWVTTHADAKKSLDALQQRLEAFIPGTVLETECRRYSLQYNQSELYLGDLIEAGAQILSGDMAQFWRLWAGLDALPDWFQAAAAEITLAIDYTGYVVDTDLGLHVTDYRRALASGDRVVAVAHSQGNLYVNAAFRVLYEGLDGQASLATRSFGVVAVASPRGFVPGGVPPEYPTHTTLLGDLVIGALASLSPLPPNVSGGPSLGDPLGHLFVRSYLEGPESASKILRDIADIALSLEVPPQTGGPTIERIARGANGSISSDGHLVAFVAVDSSLVPNDSNAAYDVVLWNRLSGEIQLQSLSTGGVQGNNSGRFPGAGIGGSFGGTISGDGSMVVFTSDSTNLATDDSNGVFDVFAHDRGSGSTVRISVMSGGAQAAGGGSGAAAEGRLGVSGNGRFIAFQSTSRDLLGTGLSGLGPSQVFVHDSVLGITELVSVDSGGNPGNCASSLGRGVSADGRFVAFASCAGNLVDGKRNLATAFDVFVRDRVLGVTVRVSVAPDGLGGNGDSAGGGSLPVISADGKFVAFDSVATDLIAGGTSGGRHVFIRDLVIGTTEVVSVANDGGQAAGPPFGFPQVSFDAAISGDGRYVVFSSDAINLASGLSGRQHVFVRDRFAGRTRLVSVGLNGVEANGASSSPDISGDGRFVVFNSTASNLTEGDSNGMSDVFIADFGGR